MSEISVISGQGSLAERPKELIENPAAGSTVTPSEDVLSKVLGTLRLSGSMQFCFMPSGNWHTDSAPSLARMAKRSSTTIPFHFVVEGSCWLKMKETTVELAEGDVVAFPFGTGHQLGAGSEGMTVRPLGDLPPRPWREIPVLRYGDGGERVRLLCGYLHCDAMNFMPLRSALPELIHIRTAESMSGDWLRATVRQIATETDNPRSGGVSMLERLTEVAFIELLRSQIMANAQAASGWLAALADPTLARCLALIHAEPHRDWSLADLSDLSGLSRSALVERFGKLLDTSPVRYVRDWRLYLASLALTTSTGPVAGIAYEAGYGTEAAFNRAFSRAYGMPPAAWRQAQGG